MDVRYREFAATLPASSDPCNPLLHASSDAFLTIVGDSDRATFIVAGILSVACAGYCYMYLLDPIEMLDSPISDDDDKD